MTITAINIATAQTSSMMSTTLDGILAGFLPSVVIGVIGWFIVKMIKDIDKRIDANTEKIDCVDEKLTERINEVEKNLTDHKEQIHREFVSKDDYVQAISSMQKKLDTIMDYVVKLTEKVSIKGD
jgi:uncharacterized protein YPO0396